VLKEYSNSLRQFLARGDLGALAAALLLALAAFYFLQALVEGLVAPAVAAIFDEPGLYALKFTISGTEFGYGSVLTGLILLVLALILVALLGKLRQPSGEPSGPDSK
jgi:large-conductance mechanosensitive channel